MSVFNPYKILGVKEDASQEEIKNAFRRLSKEHHPDSAESGDSEGFIQIKKAYDILTSKEKRDVYDIYGIVIDFMEESRKLAFTIFLDVASRCEKEDPLDAEIKNFVSLVLIPKFEDEIKAIEKQIDILTSRLGAIVRKPDDDFITERCLKVLDDYDHRYKIALLQRDLHKSALELLQKYKFDLERIGNDTFNKPATIEIFSTLLSGTNGNTFNPDNITPEFTRRKRKVI